MGRVRSPRRHRRDRVPGTRAFRDRRTFTSTVAGAQDTDSTRYSRRRQRRRHGT